MYPLTLLYPLALLQAQEELYHSERHLIQELLSLLTKHDVEETGNTGALDKEQVK